MDSYQIFAIRQDGTREKLEILQVARAYKGRDTNLREQFLVNIDVVACKPQGSTHEAAEILRLKNVLRDAAHDLKAASNA